jgi:hypothetical protein
LAQARARSPGTTHRALRSVRLTAADVLHAVAIGAFLVGLLTWAESTLMGWWHDLMLFWAGHLGIPLYRADEDPGLFAWRPASGDSQGVTPAVATGTATVMLALLASTFWMKDALTPLKCLVRTLCGLQLTALLYFMFVPALFPYTVAGHLQSMLNTGYGVMIAMAVLLALGYCVLHIPLHQKRLHPALVLAYFAVMVPHVTVLHALVLQHLSVLFMPILYLCFGIVFDVMVFVALYSWLASRLPASAVA